MAALVQRTPIAYAVIPDQSGMDEEFLRAHEGVQVLSWNTLGGRDWDGFDRYLASVHFQTSIHVHLGRKLINKRILICDYGRLAEQGASAQLCVHCFSVAPSIQFLVCCHMQA